MVQAPVRNERRGQTRVPIAEKYINQRTQSFTNTHLQAMQQWIDTGRGTEEDYYAEFRKRVERSAREWEANVGKIDRDSNLSFRDKMVEKTKLSRTWPAWTMEQEERFISQWGDPRIVDRSRLESLLREHQDHDWENALREGEIVTVTKSPWERKFYDAIVNPQDGSVPLFMEAAEIRVAEPVMFAANHQTYTVAEPSAVQMTAMIPEIPEVDIDIPDEVHGVYLTDQQKAQFQKQMEMQAKRTCPLCLVTFPKGLKPQHVGSATCKQAQEAKR